MTTSTTQGPGVLHLQTTNRLMSRLTERFHQFHLDAIVSETGAPLGTIVLFCGPGCSTALVTDHLGAALATGNSVVVGFVEEPSASLRFFLSALAAALPTTTFECLKTSAGPWNLILPDTHVVAVLTALHIVVAEDRHRHGANSPGQGSTRALLNLYSTPRTLTKEATS
ncbi:hypothetical protein [Frondihabitans sp. PAMC 28766]|uniref:hypothetical protein n=1 Tax=Frondihabitans sp. PAMC 28766 TaxID=1795630 RepID=UPI0012FF62F9|nr:hypothetical protein [Frondihabitans sp. PAMC 28766]